MPAGSPPSLIDKPSRRAQHPGKPGDGGAMNRRQFLGAVAAGTAAFAGPCSAFAQNRRYDIIVRGGRIIDPSIRFDAVADLAISGNRIAAVEANLAGEAGETLDAR